MTTRMDTMPEDVAMPNDVAMPDDVVRQIVSCLSRRDRHAIGYDVDRCISLRVPPLPVHVEPTFQTHLSDLHKGWIFLTGVSTYVAEQTVKITMSLVVYNGELVVMFTVLHLERPGNWTVVRIFILNQYAPPDAMCRCLYARQS